MQRHARLRETGFWSAGETLGVELDRAMNKAKKQADLDEYLRYRSRAMHWRGRKKKLLDHEMSDPRYFEMRACGVTPANTSYKAWFFRLGDKSRRSMVLLSRQNRTRYASPYFDDKPQPTRVYSDVCPKSRYG